jgi:hypothetical protein
MNQNAYLRGHSLNVGITNIYVNDPGRKPNQYCDKKSASYQQPNLKTAEYCSGPIRPSNCSEGRKAKGKGEEPQHDALAVKKEKFE